MTVLNGWATLDIMISIIGSIADCRAGCHRGGVFWISNRQQGIEYGLCNSYRSHSLLKIPGLWCWAIFSYWSNAFPNTIANGIPTSTISTNHCHIIAAVTKVRSCWDQCHLWPLHLAYPNPEPIATWETILPIPGASDIWFHADLMLNGCCQGLSQHSIGYWDVHSAAQLHPYNTCVHIRCWLFWEQCLGLKHYFMDQGSSHHPPLGSKPALHICLFPLHYQWSLSVVSSSAGQICLIPGPKQNNHDLSYFTGKQALEWISMCQW